MCHEASGTALTNVLGFGKGRSSLKILAKTQLIFLSWATTPGRNHPRMLTALQEAKRNGARSWRGQSAAGDRLISFMNPQRARRLARLTTKIADLFLQVRINGDVPLFQRHSQSLVEAEDAGRARHCLGLSSAQHGCVEALLDESVPRRGNTIERVSGIARSDIHKAAEWALFLPTASSSVGASGNAAPQNGPGNVQEMLTCCSSAGHWPSPAPRMLRSRALERVKATHDGRVGAAQAEFLDALGKAFDFQPPHEHGLDSQKSVKGDARRQVKVFLSLGGNFLLALSIRITPAEALSRTNLTVRIGTKLNRSDLVTGRQAIILPCLGPRRRTSRRRPRTRPANHQFVSCENSMGVIQSSRARLHPRHPASWARLRSSAAWLTRCSAAAPRSDWLAWAEDL